MFISRFILSSFIISLFLVVSSSAFSDEPLPRGKDVIHAPAIGEELCVHNLFQSNMVIQRDKPIRIWGWGDKGEEVTVTFAGEQQTVHTGTEWKWEVTFPAMPANSEPQQLVIKGEEKTLKLENILIGDVWVLGGQSNMEFPISKVENGALEMASANFDKIRHLTVPGQNGPDEKKGFARLHEWSDWSKRHFRKGDWDVCTPETVGELSAIGYVFARRLHMATQVPIGVIDASRGGTTVETWTPLTVLKEMNEPEVKEVLAEWEQKISEYDPQKDLEQRIQRHNSKVEAKKKKGEEIPENWKEPDDLKPGPAMNQNRPGNCYASMIAPIAGFAVKGAIWHQGYNNCFNGSDGAKMYAAVFPKMIESWRAAFNSTNMPFGILSLCTQGSPQTWDDFLVHMADAGPYIREAQYKTYEDLYKAGDTNIGFVSTFDLRRRWYHPQLKIPAGERIARWALATQYGMDKQIKWKPPMIQSVVITNGTIELHMDMNVGGVDDGGPMKGFAIAGEDRRYQPANIEHLEIGKDNRGRPRKDMKVLVLSSPLVPQPIHYRYAWARMPNANIQAHHNTDIPMATQRSDNWGIYEVPVEFDTENGRAAMNEVRSTLRMEDMRRNLEEAKQYIEENQANFERDMEAWKQKYAPEE